MELTDNASEVLDEIIAEPSVPETAGLRISTEGEDEPTLAAALTAGPGPQDEVLEFEHGRVFLAPAVSDRLADRVLDAEKDEDDEVVFHVRRRTEDLSEEDRAEGEGPAEEENRTED